MDKGPLRTSRFACAFDEGMRSFRHDSQLLHEAMLSGARGVWYPPTDIYETDENIVIKMSIPGIEPAADIDVLLRGSEVVIHGHRRDEAAARKTAYHHMELCYGCFERRFTINIPFDADCVEARYRDGFLYVELPKAEEPKRKQVRLSVKVRDS